jgi:hypothetical protein
MAGKKKAKVFAPPGWRQALKCQFLNFAFVHNRHALQLLAVDVKNGSMTPHEWAKSFNLAGTWVEEWAQDTLEFWVMFPDLGPEGSNPGNNEQPIEVSYPPPCDEKNDADVFSFKISVVPISKLALGITVGGSLRKDEPEDDWQRFKKRVHASLDFALEEYCQNAVRSGASDELLVPSDLDLKVEVTAAYFFCGMSPAQLRYRLVTKVGDNSTVYRWIKEIAKLLNIPMKASGHQSNRQSSLQ